MTYKNYIFDLYGTLIDIHTDENKPALWECMAKYLADHFQVSYTGAQLKEDYAKLCDEEIKALAVRNHSQYPEIKIEWVWEKLIGKECTEAEMQKLCTTYRETSRDKFNCFAKTHEVLQALKAAGSGIYLLSNAQRLFTWKELEDMNLIPYFDDIFISSDFEIKKPDGDFLKKLINKHHLDKSECVMIGNELAADGGVAQAVGMDYIITSLDQNIIKPLV